MGVSKLAHSSNIRRQRYVQLGRIDERLGFDKKEVRKKEPQKAGIPEICGDCKFKPRLCYVGGARRGMDFSSCSNKIKAGG